MPYTEDKQIVNFGLSPEDSEVLKASMSLRGSKTIAEYFRQILREQRIESALTMDLDHLINEIERTKAELVKILAYLED